MQAKIEAYNVLVKIEQVLAGADLNDLSLGDGVSGISLFYYQFYKLTKEGRYLKYCQKLIQQISQNLSTTELNASMSSGYLGIAWMFDFYKRNRVIVINSKTFFSDIDKNIYIGSLRSLMKGNYGYWNGSPAGIVYAANRLPDRQSFGYLNQFLKTLKGFKVAEEFRMRWDTLALMPYDDNIRLNIIRLELAYDLTALTNSLNRLRNIAHFDSTVSLLTEEYVSVLIGFMEKLSVLLIDQVKAANLRLKLVYLNLLLPILQTISKVRVSNDDKKSRAEVYELFFKPDWNFAVFETEALDTSLYLGSAGAAHKYKRLFLRDRNPVYLERANSLIELTIKGFLNGNGLSINKCFPGQSASVNDFGFLSGICGTGLVLMDYLDSPSSGWDGCLC